MYYKTKYNHMSCKTHAECEAKGTYCSTSGSCSKITECPIMNDSVTEKCPLAACDAQEDCNDAAYCEQDDSCYCAESKCQIRQVMGTDVCKDDAVRSALKLPDCA